MVTRFVSALLVAEDAGEAFAQLHAGAQETHLHIRLTDSQRFGEATELVRSGCYDAPGLQPHDGGLVHIGSMSQAVRRQPTLFATRLQQLPKLSRLIWFHVHRFLVLNSILGSILPQMMRGCIVCGQFHNENLDQFQKT